HVAQGRRREDLEIEVALADGEARGDRARAVHREREPVDVARADREPLECRPDRDGGRRAARAVRLAPVGFARAHAAVLEAELAVLGRLGADAVAADRAGAAVLLARVAVLAVGGAAHAVATRRGAG